MCTQSFQELVAKYFKEDGYAVELNLMLEGASGVAHKFDLRISKVVTTRLVRIIDWKRTTGINMIINADKAAADVGIAHPIVIAEKFSDHAKAYAHRRDITLLTKREILNQLRE